MQLSPNAKTILALDVGMRRTGVARAQLEAPFASPLMTLDADDNILKKIIGLVESEQAGAVVIGLPRGLNGQDTEQTAYVRQFAAALETALPVPVYWIDEAVTSEQAETELKSRGKPYTKGDIDALAATYILEDFIKEHLTVHHG